MTSGGALDGIRVIELANYVSGPYAGMMLADFGAEVIKIEMPGTGDPFRGWGAVDYSPTFGSVNRSKKSVVLDLKSAEGQAAAKSLIAGADVVVENFRPGTLERLNLGYEDCRSSNPRLIWCSITGFGNFGPLADRPGYDTVGQAMGGLARACSPTWTRPSRWVSRSPIILPAWWPVTASSRRCRRATAPARVSASTPRCSKPRSRSSGRMRRAISRTAKCRAAPPVPTQLRSLPSSRGDGKPFVIHLSSPEKFWKGLARVAGHPEWLEDARFNPRKGRQKNYDVLHGLLREVFATRDREHWLRRLTEEDVPSGPLYDFGEVFADPQVQALEMHVKVPHRTRGNVDLVRNGVRLSETPVRITSAAPNLGEHNDEVLGQHAQGRKA